MLQFDRKIQLNIEIFSNKKIKDGPSIVSTDSEESDIYMI